MPDAPSSSETPKRHARLAIARQIGTPTTYERLFFFAKEKQRVNSVFDHEYHDGDVGQVWGLQLLKSRSRMRKCGPKRPLKTTSNNQLRAARFSFKYNVTKRPELIY